MSLEADRRPSHGHSNTCRKFGDIWACVFRDTRADEQTDKQTDKQTNRHTYTLITVLVEVEIGRIKVQPL